MSQPERLRERALQAAEWLLVVLLPLLVLLHVGARFQLVGQEEQLRILDEELTGDLRLLLFQADPEEEFVRVFQERWRACERAGFPAKPAPGLLARADSLPGLTSLVFPRKAAPWSPAGETPGSRYILTSVWADLLAGTRQPSKGKLYQSLFGVNFLWFQLATSPETPMNTSSAQGNGLFQWRARPDGSGLLLYLPRRPPAHHVARSHLARGRMDRIRIAWNPADGRYAIRGGPWSLGRDLLQSGLRLRRGTITRGPWRVAVLRHASGMVLAEAARLPDRCGAGDGDGLFLPGASLALVLLVGILWLGTQWSPLAGLHLRGRTFTLLLLAVLLPLAFLALLSLGSFRERKRAMETQVHRQAMARLQALEAGHRRFLERRLEFFRRVRDHVAGRSWTRESLRRLAARLAGRSLLYFLFVVDYGTRPVGGNVPSEFVETLTSFVGLAGRQYLGKDLIDPTSPAIRDFYAIFGSPRVGLSGFLDFPDRLLRFSMGNGLLARDSWYYWDFLEPTPSLDERRQTPSPGSVSGLGPGRPAVIYLTQDQGRDTRTFLGRLLPRGVFAFDAQERVWWPRRPALPGLRKVLAEAAIGRLGLSRLVPGREGERLLTLLPSAGLPGVYFGTVSDLAHVRAAVSRSRWGFFGGLALVGLVVFLASRQVFRQVMRPIGEVSKAIAALENRQLGHRLPDLGQDEFGALAEGFNDLFAERQDLDLACEVQKYLLPARLPDIPGYDLAFRYLPVADLGGDYVDVLGFPDGRFLLLVGDVSGHGVSAALLTAMTKGFFVQGVFQGLSVTEMLERLNRLILAILNRRKLMTLFLGILDPPGHTLSWSCAGHPFPLIRTAGGAVTELGMVNYPLGVRTGLRARAQDCKLAAGDAILLYSDGIIEAGDPAGNPFGYDRLAGSFRGCAQAPAETSIATILDALETHRAETPLTDDLTLLVLRRRKVADPRPS